MACSVYVVLILLDNESLKTPETKKSQTSSSKRQKGLGKYGRKSSVGSFDSHNSVVPDGYRTFVEVCGLPEMYGLGLVTKAHRERMTVLELKAEIGVLRQRSTMTCAFLSKLYFFCLAFVSLYCATHWPPLCCHQKQADCL